MYTLRIIFFVSISDRNYQGSFVLTGRDGARPKIYGRGGTGRGTYCTYRLIEFTATAKEILICITLSEAWQIYSKGSSTKKLSIA